LEFFFLVLWLAGLVFFWRAVRAHERLADAVEKMAGGSKNPDGGAVV
jgi:hypothetical protein